MTKGPHHRGAHDRLARLAKRAWYADPSKRCARCGRTLTEHPPTSTGKRPTWDAGHKHDGQVAMSVLDYQPEVASCNRSAGATVGNRRRIGLNLRHDY